MFFKKKDLDLHLNSRKVIKVNGFSFIIKKLSVIDYMSNDKVLLQLFDIYKTQLDKPIETESIKKVIEHYKQVICAGVVNPKILYKKKDNEEGLLFDDLLKDWSLVEKLYVEIMQFTCGKKKLNRLI